VDYGSSASTVCGPGGGCAAVRSSAFSHIGPISLPTVGIATFAALLAATLVASRRSHHKYVLAGTGAVALGAATLIGIQLFVIHAVCKWCMVVDSSSIISFGLAFAIHRRGESDAETIPLRVMWGVAGAVAIAVPLLWDYSAAANVVSVPEPIAKYQQEGKVNVVMFTDFQCPFCERLHDAVEDQRPQYGDRLNLVRMMVPLDMHPGAKPAALAYLCMPEDEREEAANRFYKAENAKLTPKGVVEIGEELGADPSALSQCMADRKTLAKIEQDKTIFRNAGLSGVPTTYVNAELVRGADVVALKSALDRAGGGDGGGSDVVWLFVFIGLVVMGVGGASVWSVAAETEGRTEEAA
jgi:uncharacterized membrane protein/predicted DsbA family dithiol-disulfide isomerase